MSLSSFKNPTLWFERVITFFSVWLEIPDLAYPFTYSPNELTVTVLLFFLKTRHAMLWSFRTAHPRLIFFSFYFGNPLWLLRCLMLPFFFLIIAFLTSCFHFRLPPGQDVRKFKLSLYVPRFFFPWIGPSFETFLVILRPFPTLKSIAASTYSFCCPRPLLRALHPGILPRERNISFVVSIRLNFHMRFT